MQQLDNGLNTTKKESLWCGTGNDWRERRIVKRRLSAHDVFAVWIATFTDRLVFKRRWTSVIAVHKHNSMLYKNENGIFSIFGHVVTLNFDLLTPKPNHLCPQTALLTKACWKSITAVNTQSMSLDPRSLVRGHCPPVIAPGHRSPAEGIPRLIAPLPLCSVSVCRLQRVYSYLYSRTPSRRDYTPLSLSAQD